MLRETTQFDPEQDFKVLVLYGINIVPVTGEFHIFDC